MEKKAVKMRLSSESKLLLDNLQRDFNDKYGVDVTYSSLVNQAVKSQYDVMRERNWNEIKNKTLEFSSMDLSNDWDYQTSLMLEKEVLDFITDMQIYFKEVFDVKRVHRAFCVRLCIKSYFIYDYS